VEEASLEYHEKDFTDGYKISPCGILIYDPIDGAHSISNDKHGNSMEILD